MQLKIAHSTTYRYDESASLVAQVLRLWPAPSDAQRVSSWELRVNGDLLRPSCSDGFGNPVATHSIDQAVDRVHLSLHARIETRDCQGIHGCTLEPLPPLFYLAPTPLTAHSREIECLARAVVPKGDELERLHRLSHAVRDAVDYRPDHTDSGTTAAEAFATGRGVCQDHAHILIAAARLLDFPARYVSGYLCPVDSETPAASHAWTEIHVAGLGWVGFDAANWISPDERYVRVACGRDYHDAAPVRGLRIGGVDETLDVEVTIIEDGQQAQ